MTGHTLLGASETAERLGMSERSLRRAVAEGRITHYRLGRLIRFRPEDVEAYLASCRVDARQSA